MRATKAGHRFGIVLAALPATLAVVGLLWGDPHSDGVKLAGGAAVLIYLFCLGIGWALGALFD